MNQLLKTYKYIGQFFEKKRLSWKISFIMNSFQSLIANVGLGYSINLLLDGAAECNSSTVVRGYIILAVSIVYLVFVLPVLSYMQDSNVALMKSQMEINIFNRLIDKKYKYVISIEGSDIMTVVQNDVEEVSELYGWNMVALLQAIVSGVGSVAIVFCISWKLFVFLLVFSASLIFINRLYTNSIYHESSHLRELIGLRWSFLNDLLDNSLVLHIFSMMNSFRKKIGDINFAKARTEYSIYRKMNRVDGLVNLVSELVVAFGIIVFGCFLVSKNEISLGQLMFVFELKFGALFLFGSIGEYVNTIQSAIVASENIQCLIEKGSHEEKYVKKVFDNVISIEFQNVSFAYSDNSRNVLKDFDMSTDGEESLCFVGENGRGKSSVIKLLLGLFDEYIGKIRINGVDVREVDTSKLFAIVPQDIVMISGSIRDNILFGSTATEDEVIEAAKIARIYDEICKMKKGFNTMILEEGSNLSSGQRQRIAIARAIVQNRPVLILDECTANLDDETSSLIIHNLLSMKGKKLIAISHNKRIYNEFDRVITI